MKPPNYEEIVLTDRTNINYIKILRDKYAVPHLSSDNLVSVFYGIGYAQAQDRLWEMSFKKIVFSLLKRKLTSQSFKELELLSNVYC